MPYPASKAEHLRNNFTQPANRAGGFFFAFIHYKSYLIVLFLLITKFAATQTPLDTSQAFKNTIQGIIDKNGATLIEELKSKKPIYYKVFNPCIKDTLKKRGFIQTRANYLGLLQDRVRNDIHSMYLNPAALPKEFKKQMEDQVVNFATQWVKTGKVNPKLINELAKLCVSAQPSPKNLPPVAVVVSPVNIRLPVNTARLDGSGSYDKDNKIKSYSWMRLRGPPSSDDVLLSENTPVATASNLADGTYTYLLTVQDESDSIDSDTVVVNVRKEILPPQADAGADTTITLPSDKVVLHGKATDPNEGGRIISVKWNWFNGPSQYNIISKNSEETAVENLEEGEYTFQFIALNNEELRDTDYVSVKVNPAKLQTPPVANAGPDQTILADSSFTLTGSGTDSDGSIIRYNWKKLEGSDKSRIANENDSVTSVLDLLPGQYVFEFTVTDNDGLTATDTMVLQVQAKPNPVIPPWIWVVILLLLLAAGSYTIWYFFWWWRKKEKIILYFLNKEEEEIARHLLPNHKRTEGYLLGETNRGKIRRMKKKKLALKILSTAKLVVQTPGITSVYQYSLIKGKLTLKSQLQERLGHEYVNILPAENIATAKEAALPSFYIITLDEPLLSAYKEQLKEIGVDILQRIPRDSYVTYIKEQWQLDKIQNSELFPFIRMVRPYTAEDTGFTVRKEEYIHSQQPAASAPLVLDVVLHREEDRSIVEEFLIGHEAEITGFAGNTIRISVKPGTLSPEIISSNKFIQAVYEHLPLVLYNDIAREMIGIEDESTHHLHFTETGEGEIIAVADTGIDRTHPDLSNAIVEAISWGRTSTNDTSDPHGHGTHVTGTIAGNGTASGGDIKGMAPGAGIIFQSLLIDDKGTLVDIGLKIRELLQQAYDKGARIINISWGAHTEGYYSFDDAGIDEFVYDNQDMLVVISAGNEGGNKKDSSGRPIPGFFTVGSPASSRNGLTVGASNSKRMQEDDEAMASFSSRGPCRDFRIKPDIAAPGTNILSAKSSQAPLNNFDSFFKNTSYVFLGGTSMAAPVVSGAAAIVREYYKKKKNYPKPSAALIKATLLNGTKKLTSANAMQGSNMIPNINQGFGMLNLLTSIPSDDNLFALWFCDSFNEPSLVFQKTEEAKHFRLRLTQKTWFRVCMVFVDKPLPGGMQSDIDLVINEEKTGKKWIGNAGIGATISPLLAGEEKDDRNNIEIIREESAEPGEYIIMATARSIPLEGHTALAIVVTTGDRDSNFSTIIQ